ncbi:MAG: DUF2330 domain-containing protein [Nitrospirota bacterium]
MYDRLDPRYYQIMALSGLLFYGIWALSFDVTPSRAALLITTALATQWACTRFWRLPEFDPRSALISALSLCLLLRTNDAVLAAAAAVIAIAGKFILRVNGKHIFNPTNLALVLMLLLSDRVWVSSGQWGHAAFFAFLMTCAGGLVVHRALRSDVTLAFLGAYAGLVVGRAFWLGQPLAVPLHMFENGALLLFAFFMISDPKTTPDSRLGRVVFAVVVALGAGLVQFVLYRPNGLLWSLGTVSIFTPLIDRFLPARRYHWSGREVLVPLIGRFAAIVHRKEHTMIRSLVRLSLCSLFLLGWAASASAFCGFYVAKADTKIFNKASQVVLARLEDKTVMTMANDFKGDPTEFAVVVPVPTVLAKDQIHVGDQAVVDHLDAYSAPRLVEYYDENPCARVDKNAAAPLGSGTVFEAAPGRRQKSEALGVKIEARYTVGEYDILILSATQSHGLETWLRENGYRVPPGASRVLGSYLKQGMKFFVAKVNLSEQERLGYQHLRPIQVAYESPKFMLPIRLGMVNADGAQELFVYTLTQRGRVEATNYRTVKLPSNAEIPIYVKNEFSPFYQALFAHQTEKERGSVVFVEYAWDMGWCDPCAADPLSRDELKRLGVFWLVDGPTGAFRGPAPAANVFLTRLHVRYDAASFPEDLVFQETADRTNFQVRYVQRHAWTGEASCPEVVSYRRTLAERREREAQTLASLTGWALDEIRAKMELDAPPSIRPWYKKLWE